MITGYVKSGVERASKAGVILVVTCCHLPIDYLPRLSFDEHASWHLFHLFIFPPPIFEPSVYENCTFKLGANAKKATGALLISAKLVILKCLLLVFLTSTKAR